VKSELPSNALATNLTWSKANGNEAPRFLSEWDVATERIIVKRRTDLKDPADWTFVPITDANWVETRLMRHWECSKCNDPKSCKVELSWASKVFIALGGVLVFLLCLCCWYRYRSKKGPVDSALSDQDPVKFEGTEAQLQ